MKQLVELEQRIEALEALRTDLSVVCLTQSGKGDEATAGLREKTGFDGPVLIDVDNAVKKEYGLYVGSVVVVDPHGVIRWQKPGAKYKRPRAELVEHAFRAIVARDREPEAIDEALEQLGSSSAKRRVRALERLGELEAVEAIGAMEQALLNDRQKSVRAAAAAALAHLRDPGVLTALALALEDREADVRRAAGATLVGFDDDYEGYPSNQFRHEYTHCMSDALQAQLELLVPAAESLLQRRDVEERRLGARLLFRLKHASLLARYVELSSDKDEDVRYAALGGLFELRAEPAAVAAARLRLEDRSASVRKMAQVVVEGPKGKVRE